jgi:hypothetical protein
MPALRTTRTNTGREGRVAHWRLIEKFKDDIETRAIGDQSGSGKGAGEDGQEERGSQIE